MMIDRVRMNCDHHSEIKKLSLEIKNHFHSIKKARVACVAMGKCNGNGGNLWKAVKIARNVVCLKTGLEWQQVPHLHFF